MSSFESKRVDTENGATKPVPEKQELEKCRWFKRGWTLQELLAPSMVYFYVCNWNYIGSRNGLASLISAITQIPSEVLTGPESQNGYFVAARMSWASARQTTRDEDIAYCLFGLFKVNMPLLYGEGAHGAFRRLQ